MDFHVLRIRQDTHHSGNSIKWHQNWDGYDQRNIHFSEDQSSESFGTDRLKECLETDLMYAVVFQT
jgi:hypothetical protein